MRHLTRWPIAVVVCVALLVLGALLYGCESHAAELQKRCIAEHGTWSDAGNFGNCTLPKGTP